LREPSWRALPLLLPAAWFAAWGIAWAQEQAPPENRWQDTAEFSYVVTAGNSQTNTLGFKDKLWKKWDSSGFELNAGGVRAEATAKFAVGDPNTPTNFEIRDETKLSAESYYLNGRYDRKVSPRFFWFVAAGWDRNTFSGIENRYTGVAGVGNTWADTDTTKFRTDYSVTYTKEDDVVKNPGFNDSFLGARVSSNLLRKFGATTTFTDDLVIDENLDDTSDLRANMINSVAVAMSKRLALKVSLQWLYDHQPAFGMFDLFDKEPSRGGVKSGSVTHELDTLDTVLTASLVVNI